MTKHNYIFYHLRKKWCRFHRKMAGLKKSHDATFFHKLRLAVIHSNRKKTAKQPKNDTDAQQIFSRN